MNTSTSIVHLMTNEGIHIADCNQFIGRKYSDGSYSFDYEEELKYCIIDDYILYEDEYNNVFAVTPEMKTLLELKFIRFSGKRETYYIEWDYLYDNRDLPDIKYRVNNIDDLGNFRKLIMDSIS